MDDTIENLLSEQVSTLKETIDLLHEHVKIREDKIDALKNSLHIIQEMDSIDSVKMACAKILDVLNKKNKI